MGVNVTSIRTSSNGVWQGDNPLDYAFPLLILQSTLILAVSRFLALLFKPLRQPRVIAEMLGGILLGPSVLGRNQDYMHRVFPKWSTPILESVASFGLLFFLFLVGLELDFNSIRRSGWRAFAIAVAGMSSTFTLGVGLAIVFHKAVDGADAVGFPQYLVFMGVALSITAFPVLARVLAELKLLTTPVGETAMAAAAINDVAAWISLALAVALAGNGGEGPRKSPLISIWVLLSGVVFVGFMMVAIKPAMKWMERRCSPRRNTGGDETYIYMLDPRRRSGGGLHQRLDRHPRNFRRVHLRIDDSERRRFGKAINGENRGFRFGVVAAVVFCFERAENQRGEDQRRRGVGAAGASDHDGVRGEDHRNICGGDVMYDSGEGVDNAGSVDEYERAGGVDCS